MHRAFAYSEIPAMNERRKDKRLRVDREAFAVVKGPPRELAGRIRDISLGGLAFSYVDTHAPVPESSRIDILVPEDDFYMDDLPFTRVLDCELADDASLGAIVLRRQGVRFLQLTSAQITQLAHLIQSRSPKEP